TVISAPTRASQNGDSGCFTVTAAEPFGLSLDDHDVSLPACCGSRSFDAGAVVSVEASTLSWLQSSSKSLRSASSASRAAASVAAASGFSPGGTVCAPAGSTDAMLTAASISSTARPYRIVEAITPPACLIGDDAYTSAQNCGGAERRHTVIARSKATEAIQSLTTKVNGLLR